MSIQYDKVKDSEGFTLWHQIVITDYKSFENFKLLVSRALNCWDNAPVELKEFGDILEYGSVQQDYKSQAAPMTSLSSRSAGVDKFPGVADAELPKCPDCLGVGMRHHHDCPALRKKVEAPAKK